MKRKQLSVISAALALVLMMAMLSGCGKPVEAAANSEPAGVSEPAGQPAAETEPAEQAEPAEQTEPAEQAEPTGTETETARQDGERFEAIIVMEGMEETVQYEHIRNDALGFEMDYDYESLVRLSEADRERFVSNWDDPEHPENYLEVTCSAEDAETAAAAIAEELSKKYEIFRDDSFMLQRAGICIFIDASAEPGGQTMPDQLQAVYIIPAADGCRIATAHYSIEAAEGFGRRFRYCMDTFSAIDAQG